MKLITSYKYHLLNLIGWQVYLLSTLTFDKLSYGFSKVEKFTAIELNTTRYFIVEGVLCALLGFVLSNIVLYFVDYKIEIGSVSKKQLYQLVLAFIGTQFLYNLFLWPMLSIPLKYYLERDLELTFVMKLANVPVFTISFLVWLFVVMSYKVIKFLKETRIRQLQLESDLKESTLNALKGQINPHFMFNSLNNIRGLILENPQKSREMITRLSEMLRYSLTKNNTNAISLEEEIEVVDNFIAISKIQFEDRLTFVKEMDPQTIKMSIPPMVVQLLVENAVKHGISNLKQGGEVKLITRVLPQYLQIEVENSGKLVINKNSTQLGLQNIKERIALLYKNKATFTLEENENKVVACIKLPLE